MSQQRKADSGNINNRLAVSKGRTRAHPPGFWRSRQALGFVRAAAALLARSPSQRPE